MFTACSGEAEQPGKHDFGPRVATTRRERLKLYSQLGLDLPQDFTKINRPPQNHPDRGWSKHLLEPPTHAVSIEKNEIASGSRWL